MKKNRITSVVLAAILAFSALCITYVSAEAPPATVSVNVSEFHDGIMNGRDSAVLENTEKDGKKVVKITPNPLCTTATYITLDGYKYHTAGIDLSRYRWASIEYYYESPAPVSDKMYIAILSSGKAIKSEIGRVTKYSRETLVSGTWATMTFDFTDLETAYDDTNPTPNARQMHIRPFTSTKVVDLKESDVLYISTITFYEKEPNLVTHESYMNGYTDGTFKPAGTITRAEACTVIARLLEKEENIAGASSFADVTGDMWFAKYVGFCAEKGLLAAYSGNFLPNQPITRAEFSELVYLTGLAQDKGIAASFADVPASHPKYASIMAAASAGLINGYKEADGTYTFRPDNTITRAEVVTVINRARGTSKNTEKLTENTVRLFLDVDRTHWAFADIAEATVPHVETDGAWVYTTRDPLTELINKVGLGAIYDLESSNAKIAQLDALEAKRIEEIRNTPDMDLSALEGKIIYVSSSTGNNDNDGLTPETPVKSAAKGNALAAAGDAILFMRGDLWREQFSCKPGIIYSAYGEGAKPMFYGSPENGADETKWSLVHEDKETGALIWMYKNQKMRDIGSIIFNEGEGFAVKEYPSCIEDKYIVRNTTETPFDYIKELDRNFEFFHSANSSTKMFVIDATAAVGQIYLRCDNGNPGKVFDSIEFITSGALITVGTSNDVTLDNLCLKYSAFGVSASGTDVKNLTITNMEIGWIGGNVASYTANADKIGIPTRYGNGVELYGGCDGFTIDNCYVYQCYDAGITHQVASGAKGDISEDNIRFTNNVLTDSVYNIEYFFRPETRVGENVLYENNLCRRAGFGFGSNRPDTNVQRNVRSGTTGNNFVNFVIRNNVFDRAVCELVQSNMSASLDGKTAPVLYDSNVYIQGVNNGIFSYAVDKSARMDLIAEKSIKEVLGDKNAEVYFTETIPVYSFGYTTEKTAPVTESDRRVFAIEKPSAEASEGESSVVEPPLHIEVQKQGNIYRDSSKATILNVKTDPDTRVVYNEVIFLNESASIRFDCYGIKPAIPVDGDALYIKILMRTNQKVKPYVIAYSVKDVNGQTYTGAAPSGSAVSPTEGTGVWEEVLVKLPYLAEEIATIAQFQIYYAGSGIRGTSFYGEKAVMPMDAVFDIAGWAVFSNLASAQNFDLIAAASE